MSLPSIEKRKQKRFIYMSTNLDMLARVKALLPPDWSMSVICDLSEIGEWNDILLYRFMILDLNEQARYDPLDVIQELRTQYQVMTPVFCFGGDQAIQNEMRMARADRFFSDDELVAILPQFIEQYNWG